MSVAGLEGTVRDLSSHGEGVVKSERGVVFAAGALPGERVALDDVRQRGGALRAGRVKVLDASSQRVEPACPVASRCGGCPLMIASAPLSDRFKRGLLEGALRDLPWAEEGAEVRWIPAASRLGYRMRARLAWSPHDKGARLGYRAARSDHITDVRSCAVLHPALDGALAAIRREIGKQLAGEGVLHLAMGEAGGPRPVAALRSDAAQDPETYRAIEALVESGALAGAAVRFGGASVDATFGDPREVRAGADGRPLFGTVAGFSQAHDEVNRALVEEVVALARPDGRAVLELFSGAGNLTIALAPSARRLVAIEQDEPAASAARENLAARELDATVRAGDAERYEGVGEFDVVVLDPPRTGASRAIRRLCRARVPEIVYVSCDPATLRRDLRALVEAGYRVADAVGLDMFPQTAHLESVVRLTLDAETPRG